MSKCLQDWVETDVQDVVNKPLDWLSTHHFFRDPSRALYCDSDFFFSPADGIILYQTQVTPEEEIIDIKGTTYSLRDVMRDESYDQESLVIGIFMTMYDVHVNRVPYAGTLYYKETEPIQSYNTPMLSLENDLIEEKIINNGNSRFLHRNQRVINKIYASSLGLAYYVVQIADYDVDCITPFQLGQGNPYSQNQRFSMIRYGSQVELVVPVSEDFEFELIQDTGVHVEAGVDPLIHIHELNDEEENEGGDTPEAEKS